MIEHIKFILFFGTIVLLSFIGACIVDYESKADDWHLIDLNEISITGIKYFPGGVDPLLTQNQDLTARTLGSELELNLNTTVLNYGYWESRIHSSTDQVLHSDGSTSGGQFRLVGLEFHLGVNLTDYFRFGYYHHSQHLLDTNYSGGHFPVEDGIEIKIFLFKSKEKPATLF